MTTIGELPEECLSQILSLTTPVDVLRSSAVSKQFLSASESDTVWRSFLPSYYVGITSLSGKYLFFNLCRFPKLLDNTTKSFALDKWSGKKCYMLGSRALRIMWVKNSEYLGWESVPESRFPECAVLLSFCWLDLTGKIRITLLSPGTTYGAYFVFKINANEYGEHTPVTVYVAVVGEDGLRREDLHPTEFKNFYLKPRQSEPPEDAPGGLPVVRDDGWMEIEMGRYQVSRVHDEFELEMTLKELAERADWKDGLVIHGIEVRPLLN